MILESHACAFTAATFDSMPSPGFSRGDAHFEKPASLPAPQPSKLLLFIPTVTMKLDTKALRYLTAEDWRVLTAVSPLFYNNTISPD